MIPVPRDVLEALAQSAPHESLPSRTDQHQFNGHGEAFNLERWIADHNLDLIGPTPWQGGQRWVFRACPWNADHRNRSAYIVQRANGAIAAGCHHNGCAREDWHTLRDLVEPGWRHMQHGGRPRRRAAHDRTKSRTAEEPEGAHGSSDSEAEETHLTDWGNARRLVHRFGHDVHYVHPWHKWLHWNGQWWEVDHLGVVEMLAKRVIGDLFRWASTQVEAISNQLHGETFMSDRRQTLLQQKLAKAITVLKWALKSESAPRLHAMIALAESEPMIPVLPHELDANPWLLNCLTGTIELRTGTRREHRREDLLTKRCPVEYDPEATCPQWQAFLSDVMAGNQALMDYLQRAVGYSLIGSVEEQCLFFLHGTGQTGKSTFLGVLQAMLGDYAIQAIPELLIVRGHEQRPTERADLFGKRLVATIEMESGKHLAETLVKQLTGGDRIRARRMREDFWEFEPTHKIWLAANHKPLIRGQDHAIWRRIKLMPFTVKIPDEKKDPTLSDKLKGELPGILAWTVRGCQEWQRIGLAEPAEVTQAVHAYQAEMDTIGQFLKDSCLLRPGHADIKTQSSLLYEAFCKWSGDYGVSQKAFSERLLEMDYTKKPGGDGRMYWLGIGLIVGVKGDGG